MDAQLKKEQVESLQNLGAEVSIIAEPYEVLIDFRGSSVSDQEVAECAKILGLSHLWLTDCAVTNHSISKLSECKSLSHLDVGGTLADGTILQDVSAIETLTGLGLRSLHRVGESLWCLHDHPSIDQIDLSSTLVELDQFVELINRTSITGVSIDSTQIAPAQVGELRLSDASSDRVVFCRFETGDVVSVSR